MLLLLLYVYIVLFSCLSFFFIDQLLLYVRYFRQLFMVLMLKFSTLSDTKQINIQKLFYQYYESTFEDRCQDCVIGTLLQRQDKPYPTFHLRYFRGTLFQRK